MSFCWTPALVNSFRTQFFKCQCFLGFRGGEESSFVSLDFYLLHFEFLAIGTLGKICWALRQGRTAATLAPQRSEVNKMAPIVLWAWGGPGDRMRNPVDGPRPYLRLHAAIFSIVKALAMAKLHTWTQILPSAQGRQLHPKSVGVECVSKSDIWQQSHLVPLLATYYAIRCLSTNFCTNVSLFAIIRWQCLLYNFLPF